ncbi:hypothetical protein MU985_003154 [Salmonella enterica]|nr:hypothetical protein [Salmonella enterica]
MNAGIEAMALETTDARFVSKAASQIVSPLVAANHQLVHSSVPVSPDEVRRALDKVSVAIASVDKRIHECTDIISALSGYTTDKGNIIFTTDFPSELKARAELLTYQIENLKDVFSLVENSPAWKPYLAAITEKRQKAVRAMSNLRNAYLNIALITEQYVCPVPAVDSSVEGDIDEFNAAVAASNALMGFNPSERL